MHFADLDPKDIPPPPTVAGAARMFGAPLIGFVRQPALTELGVGTSGSSSNGGPVTLESVAISYTVWRNPDDLDDPANRADLSGPERDALDQEPVRPLPEWMHEARRLARFPSLWEAVMTTRVLPTDGHSPASALIAHTNHVLMNTFRAERVVGEFPGDLDSPVAERHIERVSVTIDGNDVPGLRIDTDPNVYSVGADLGDRILTAVVARDHLPYVLLAFETRA